MTIYPTKIAAHVAAVNAVHAELNRIMPLLINRFSPLVGQKIMKTGGLMEKFKPLLPAVLGSELSIYRNTSAYSLSYTVKASFCASSGSGTYTHGIYYEQTGYVGNLDGYHLKDLYTFTPFRCDYTEEYVRASRQAVKDAEAALSTAKSALNPFGMYDT